MYPVRETTIGRPSGPPMRPIANRNQDRSPKAGWVGGVHTSSRSRSRDFGPCTAMLCSWSVECLIHTWSRFNRPASWRSQVPSYSSPPTKRNVSGPSRNTVASSSIPPVSLQTAV